MNVPADVMVVVVAGCFLAAVLYGTTGRQPLKPIIFVLGTSALAADIFLDPRVVEGGRRGSLELYGLAVGGALGWALLVEWSRGRLRFPQGPGVPRAYRWLLTIGVLAAVVGATRGNSRRYMIGDGYDLFVTIGMFVLVVSSIRRVDRPERVVRVVAWAALVSQIGDAAVGIPNLASGAFGRMNAVLWMHNLVGVIAWSAIALSQRRRGRTAWAWVAVFAMISVALLSAFRTYVLILVVVAVVMLMSSRATNLVRAIPRLLIGLTIAGGSLLVAQQVPTFDGAIDRAWSTLATRTEGSRATQSSDDGRLIEIRGVRAEINEDQSILLTGTGFGGEYELPRGASPYARSLADDEGRKHFVHVFPAAALFRFGVLGLIVLTALLAGVVRMSWRTWRRDRNVLSGFLCAAAIAYSVNAFFFSEFIGDIVFATVAGTTVAVSERRRQLLDAGPRDMSERGERTGSGRR